MPLPSAAIIDRSEREDHGKGGPRGYDGLAKRYPPNATDRSGYHGSAPGPCVVHAASIQDRDGAKLVLAKLLNRFPRL